MTSQWGRALSTRRGDKAGIGNLRSKRRTLFHEIPNSGTPLPGAVRANRLVAQHLSQASTAVCDTAPSIAISSAPIASDDAVLPQLCFRGVHRVTQSVCMGLVYRAMYSISQSRRGRSSQAVGPLSAADGSRGGLQEPQRRPRDPAGLSPARCCGRRSRSRSCCRRRKRSAQHESRFE
jgi:hypothetical protein